MFCLLWNFIIHIQVRSKILLRELFSTLNRRLVRDSACNVVLYIVVFRSAKVTLAVRIFHGVKGDIVDLNPIRATMAETIEQSDFTSVQRKIESIEVASMKSAADSPSMPDCFLAPLTIDERNDPIGPCASQSGKRCSDKGFISMSTLDYLELLDATARIMRADKAGATSMDLPPIFERLKLDVMNWKLLVKDFGRVFSLVAGTPKDVYEMRSLISKRRFHLKRHESQVASTR